MFWWTLQDVSTSLKRSTRRNNSVDFNYLIPLFSYRGIFFSMNQIVFYSTPGLEEGFYPFSLTRSVADLRLGALTIREKWELALPLKSKPDPAIHTKEDFQPGHGDLVIPANVLPNPGLVRKIAELRPGQAIRIRDRTEMIYLCAGSRASDQRNNSHDIVAALEATALNYPWDLVKHNASAIADDVEVLQESRTFQNIPKSNWFHREKDIWIEQDASVNMCLIDTTDGPVYISNGALVMEGSMIKGPVFIGKNAVVKMGTRIYGGTTVGPFCTVGGEIKNSIMFAFSNKAHDGYLGDSVIGEWCNLGAGTTNSNIKNNASTVRIWNNGEYREAGQKAGMFMGDYSKTAINSSINTGTVIGVCANVFGAGLLPKHIASFSWGSDGRQRYQLEQALRDIEAWMKLKHQAITAEATNSLKFIFDNL